MEKPLLLIQNNFTELQREKHHARHIAMNKADVISALIETVV